MATHKKKTAFSSKRKILFIVLLLALLIAAGAGAYYYYAKIQDASEQATTVQTTEEKIDAIVDRAQDSPNDAANEKTELKTLAENETDKSKKVQYQAAAVDLYINTGDAQGAKEAAEAYEATDESALSAAAVAKAYEDLGEYANAAKYYGIAAERSPKPLSPEERAPYNDYLLQKRAMEAKG